MTRCGTAQEIASRDLGAAEDNRELETRYRLRINGQSLPRLCAAWMACARHRWTLCVVVVYGMIHEVFHETRRCVTLSGMHRRFCLQKPVLPVTSSW